MFAKRINIPAEIHTAELPFVTEAAATEEIQNY